MKRRRMNVPRGLALAVAISLILRVGFLLFLNPFGWEEKTAVTHMHPDGFEYHNLAKGIYSGVRADENFMASVSWNVYPFRTPVYPAFLAAVYLLFGVKAWVVYAIQILFDACTVALIYCITSRVTSIRHAPAAAAAAYAASPVAVIYAMSFLSETLYTMILASSVLAVLMSQEREWKPKITLPAGFLFGLSTLVKPMSLYMPGFAAVYVVLSSSVAVRKRLIYALLLLGVYMLTLSPWQMRNLSVYGYYSLASVDGYNLCNFNAAVVEWLAYKASSYAAVLPQLPRTHPMCPSTSDAANPFTLSKMQKTVGLEYMLAHPATTAMAQAKGVVELFFRLPSRTGPRLWWTHRFTFMSYGLKRADYMPAFNLVVVSAAMAVNVLAAVGVILMTRKNSYGPGVWLILLCLGYLANVIGMLGSTEIDRYVIPILPYLSVFAGTGAAWLFTKVSAITSFFRLRR